MFSFFHDILINFITKLLELSFKVASARRDHWKLLQQLENYEEEFESQHDGTIVADGVFPQCLRSHRTLEKIVVYGLGGLRKLEREDVFLERLHGELLQQLQARTTKPLTRLDAHTVRVFLEEILNRVKESLADKTSPNQGEIKYRLQQTEATGARIEEKIDHLIRKESEDQFKGCEVPCDNYQTVKISVKLPTLENARYYLYYVRAGKNEWDHKGALVNKEFLMKSGTDGIFSVSLEDVPVNLGFQFKCYAQCETEKDMDAVSQTLQEYFFPLYQSSRFSEYQNGTVYVNDADGKEINLISSSKQENVVWFILPEYHPYITDDKQHPFLNNYYHYIR